MAEYVGLHRMPRQYDPSLADHRIHSFEEHQLLQAISTSCRSQAMEGSHEL